MSRYDAAMKALELCVTALEEVVRDKPGPSLQRDALIKAQELVREHIVSLNRGGR